MKEEIKLTIERDFYTVKEVAKILNVSVMTVWRLINEGKLEIIKIRNTTRIPKESLIEYINSLKLTNV